ncbi:MAG: anaerobic ribonucleoside-triphosphate reductase activating protein [Patescibacteria group bacterium]|nr:anaerobic ribonucleoside-triphosphate reductase activating protein [Patescibacteria group bacterium]
MNFYGLKKVSLIEWPNKICAVLFVAGCNFRCPFCYNRDLVLNYQKLPKISEKKILNFLKSRKGLIDGVMISGGEPLAEREIKNKNDKIKNDLINFIKKVKKMGFSVGIETNGSNPKLLEKLIKEKLVDFVAMDIKSPLGSTSNVKCQMSKYEELTGVKVDLAKIKKSMEIIKNSGLDYEFRTTVAPLLSEKDILTIAKELKGAKRYALQIFQPIDSLINPSLAKMKFLTKNDLEKIGQKIKGYFKKFEIRG